LRARPTPRSLPAAWLPAALLIALLTALARPAGADPLRVAAAANLQKVFTEALLPAFTKKTGVAVTPTFGATKQLATQIENGAPVDVFVAADTVTVQKLAAERAVVAGTVHPYAVGRLVLWSSAQAARHPRRVQDLADAGYARIAIANPRTAPYGLAAQQAFARAGVAAQVAPRVVQAENIAQALQFAQSRNADVCLTALSLVIEDKADPYVVVPENLHDPITQSLGLVRTTTQTTQGLQFIDFLTGRDAAKVWKRYGYALPRTGK
jgi:molybdate transport system substrate-binding protein